MSVKERAIAIKLLKLQENNPQYVERIGVSVRFEFEPEQQIDFALKTGSTDEEEKYENQCTP